MKARIRAALIKRMGQVLDPACCAEIELELLATEDLSIDPKQFGAVQCGTVTFAVESFRAVLPELHGLHVEHYAQTEVHRRHIPMNPDYDAMTAEELNGSLVQITARQGGTLVGHIRLYIRTGRHTKTKHAIEDAMYLREHVRGGRTAMRMVQYGELVLRQLGVSEVRCTAKLVNGAARFFEGLGYKPVATELVKFLEGE